MSEQVKVFKNVVSQNLTYGSAFDVVLASTSSTERAVIKSVDCKRVGAATLDLDGQTLATSTAEAVDMVASGSLIMDVSSVLKLKFAALPALLTADFKAVVFSNGSDSFNFLQGTGVQDSTGTSTQATSCTNRSTSTNYATTSAFAAIKPGDTAITFYRYESGTMYEYAGSSASQLTSYNFGSGYGACTDGTYMYNIPANGTTQVYRRHLKTSVDTNFTTASTVYGQVHNQGSFLLHHNGYLYTKQEAGSATMYIVKIADGSVVEITNGSAGSYSDGACIVTTLAGKSYVVEQGEGRWQWYEIGGSLTQFTNETGSSGASTEYGNGGFEIAPGIAMMLCEQSDDLSIIDMNTSPPSWSHIASPSTRNILTHNSLGNNFAVAGYLQRDESATTYDAYTSGILISEDS
tara:strand:+ start:392 stop:1609 length:1218 start_codon:yes stop_codon:yes gene_type:complete